MYHHTCALVALGLSPLVRAAPTVPTSRLLPRQQQGSNDSSSGITKGVWIPLVVIGTLFILGLVGACSSGRFRVWSWNWGTTAAQAAGVTTGTSTAANAREVTADQLAGTNANSGNNANTNATAGSNRARRPRRTRRTPSQISTHSLPAYAKEPGEQEIVIVRGAEDMEDVPLPITVTMPVVDEHAADSSEGSLELTRTNSAYTPMPESPTDMPLLHNDEAESQQHLSPGHIDHAPRSSFDSAMSFEENARPQYTDDAPPYEAVPLESPPDQPTSVISHEAAAATTTHAIDAEEGRPSTDAGSTRRRSMFRSIFNPRNSRIAPSPIPPSAASPEPRASTHTRGGSNPSMLSVAPSERELRPRSRIRHQPSQSGSGSMFSLLSRTRSNGNLVGNAERLTSPSLISLNSISAPLSHTLVRTEFTYPRGGPTPEQLKLISSRESFARFGVPYGPDAIAYASASRVELEPPPGFEEVAGPSGSPDSSTSEERDGNPEPGSNSQPAGDAAVSSVDAAAHHEASETQESNAAAPKSITEPSSSSSTAGANVAVDAPSSHPVASESPATEASVNAVPPAPSSFSPAGPQPPAEMLSPPSSAAPVASPTTPNAPPPSAFKSAFNTGSLPTRAASRASSYMTFATAEESLPPSEPPTPGASQADLHLHVPAADRDGHGDGDSAEGSAAVTPVHGTPRTQTRHLHESTDMIVTPTPDR
ncbi:hypothetical protein BD413DRAFT_35132 [Trametes elegans]|nr:hypothetical protein BD413DRAFT_35132 [Trametes elegans]